jgi:hypothetical protein
VQPTYLTASTRRASRPRGAAALDLGDALAIPARNAQLVQIAIPAITCLAWLASPARPQIVARLDR